MGYESSSQDGVVYYRLPCFPLVIDRGLLCECLQRAECLDAMNQSVPTEACIEAQ